MQRSLWLTLAVVGLAGAGWLALGAGSTDRPMDDAPAASPRDASPDGPVTTRIAAEPQRGPADVERRELEIAQDMGLLDSDDLEGRALLALRGRVVDSAGRAVAGATVEPRVRRSPRAIFERGGQPAQDMDWRTLFLDRALAKATVTSADGAFAFDGRAFGRGTSVELSVRHSEFAPQVVQREWTTEDGDLVVGDVVLGSGAAVSGVVVGPNGTPVPSATVTFVADGRGGPGGPGGPGGRGGRGPGGGRFGGGATERLQQLVGAAETDAAGRFSLAHVPAGQFRLGASAPRHVDGRSDQADAKDGETVDVGEIALGPGAEIRGVVVDATGGPVFDAEVTAMLSREAWQQAMQDPTQAGNNGGGRGGRGGFGGGPGGPGGARQTAKTDKDGRFALDRVPQAPLRMEIRHPRFIDQDVEPIDPVAQQEIQVRVAARPIASGVVVDAGTGEPVTTYGIRARPMPAFGMGGGRGGGRGNLADMANRLADANPDIAARITEMQTRVQREEDWRKQRIGGSGVIPGRTPAPSAHADGVFRLDELQPGDFVFDVDAPGYVSIAAGPFGISAEGPNEGLVVRLERGAVFAGRVVNFKTGAAVAGARVALAIPPLEDGTPDPMAALRGFAAGMGGGRGGGNRDVIAEIRTGSNGRFALRPLRAGTYVLTVDSDGYPGLRDPAFTLVPGMAEMDLRLDPGARVYGTVSGLEAGKRSRLEFTHAETGTRRRADIHPDDGSYSIEGLLAGGWFIRVMDDSQGGGPGRGGFRGMMGDVVAAQTGAAPDLNVPPGAEVRYDVGAQSLELGVVRGRVFRNGAPGDGLEVRLVAQTPPGGLDPDIGRMVQGRMGQLWSGRVSAEDGTFSIEDVPPGDYALEVHRRGGGGGGRGGRPQVNGDQPMHSEPLSIRKGQTAERLIEIRTASVAVVVAGPDAQSPPRARVTLVLASDAGDTAPDAWGNLPSVVRLGLRDGRAEGDVTQPGVYRFAIEARGFKTVIGTVTAVLGAPAQVDARLEVDPNAPVQDPNAPAGPGQGNAGRRGGANGGAPNAAPQNGGNRRGGGNQGGNAGGNRRGG